MRTVFLALLSLIVTAPAFAAAPKGALTADVNGGWRVQHAAMDPDDAREYVPLTIIHPKMEVVIYCETLEPQGTLSSRLKLEQGMSKAEGDAPGPIRRDGSTTAWFTFETPDGYAGEVRGFVIPAERAVGRTIATVCTGLWKKGRKSFSADGFKVVLEKVRIVSKE